MPISKLKNLIILILLAAMVFLLALVIPKRLADANQRAAEHAQLVRLFASYGISLSERSLPTEQNLYTVELPNTQSCGSTLAALLFENPLQMQDALSHESCRFTDRNGTLFYDSSGMLRVQLKNAKEISDLQSGSKKMLRDLDYAANTVSAPQRLSAGVFSVTCTQELFGVPVFSEPLCLVYTNNRLTQIEGSFFSGAKKAVRYDRTLCISCADALVTLLSQRDAIGWVGGSILSVTQGYRRADTASSSIRMVPCWKIVTDAGAFYVNGITGEVSVIEEK